MFSETPPPPNNMEIQNFQKKNDPSLGMYENIRVPPPPPPPGTKPLTGVEVINIQTAKI